MSTFITHIFINKLRNALFRKKEVHLRIKSGILLTDVFGEADMRPEQ